MKPRSLLAAATALVAATAGLFAASPAEAAGPSHVRTTMALIKGGAHQVTATGRAPAGARVYLQDRFDEHDLFATQKVGRASSRGTFRLTTKTDRTDGTYRVCVVAPGKDPCSEGRLARLVKRTGKITLTEVAPRIVEGEASVVARGRVTRWLRLVPLELRYRDPGTGKWRPSGAFFSMDGRRFTASFDTFSTPRVSKQGLHLRLVARGNPDIRKVAKEWTVDAYARRSLATFPVVSGSVVQSQIFVTPPIYSGPSQSEAVALGGTSPSNSVTLTVPAGCGRIQASTAQSALLGSPGPYTASVARNGVTVWSFDSSVPGSVRELWLDVIGGDTLTLTTSYDAARPEERPWFVKPSMYVGSYPFALCAAP